MSKNKIVGAATGIIKPNYEKILETKAEKKNFYTVDEMSPVTLNVYPYYERISNVIEIDDTWSSGMSMTFTESVIYRITHSEHVYIGSMFYPEEGAEFVIHCQNQNGVLLETMSTIYGMTGDTQNRWELKTGEAVVIKCENGVLKIVSGTPTTQIVLSDGVNKIKFPKLKKDIYVGNIIGFDEMLYSREDGCLHVKKDGVDIAPPQFIGILSEKKMTLTDVSEIYDKAIDVKVREILFSDTELAYPNVVNEISTKEDNIELYITVSPPHSIGDIYAYNVLGDKSITLLFQRVIYGTNENITLYFDGKPVGNEWGIFVIDVQPNHCVAIEYDGERYNILGEYGDDTQISLTDGTHKAIFPQFDKDRTLGDMIWKNARDFTTNEGAVQVTGSGDISFATNKKYALTLTGDASIHFPTEGLSTDISHSILIDLFMGLEYSVNFSDSENIMYEDGNTPIVSAGNYRIEAFYDPNVLKWCIRVDSYRYDWSEALGLRADFENGVYERLEAAVGKSNGADFDGYTMYGGRRRCNVADDGTILAYEGEAGYVTDGSNGQVMVYQPAFYYKVIPLVLDGLKIRKAEYYVSEKPLVGFKRHPAFYDRNGNEIDYILLSAFEGGVYDVDGGEDGTGAYVLGSTDASGSDFSADKLSSIAGITPFNNILESQVQQLAQNRGEGWRVDHILSLSMQQLLLVIEGGSFCTASVYGRGIHHLGVLMPTGSKNPNNYGYQHFTYRGVESIWGNTNKLISGVSFDENRAFVVATAYHETIGTTLEQKTMGAVGWISSFGYNSVADWLFIPAENNGTSASPIGDQSWQRYKPGSYVLFGIYKSGQNNTGAFGTTIELSNGGGRLLFVPTAEMEGET